MNFIMKRRVRFDMWQFLGIINFQLDIFCFKKALSAPNSRPAVVQRVQPDLRDPTNQPGEARAQQGGGGEEEEEEEEEAMREDYVCY